MDIDIARFRTWYSKIKPLSNNLSIKQDYHPNKQSVVESPKEQTVDESQPEQLIGVLQSVGDSSQYEKWREAAAERKRKSRSEKERRLLKKGE